MLDATDQPPIGLDALERAIDEMTLAGLSRALGVKYQLIQGWRGRERRFATPAEFCPSIERATDGRIRCEELRPDVDWSVLRAPAPDGA